MILHYHKLLCAKGTSVPKINDGFHKNLDTGFCSLQESKLPRNVKVPSISEVDHRLLINIMC